MTTWTHPLSFGRFRVLRVTGSGETQATYEALDPESGRTVALRSVAAEHAQAEQERLWRRLRALRHPNIVSVIDFGHEDDHAYVATALVQGETLAQFLARAGRIPLLQGLALVAQLLSALQRAHERNLVHTGIDLDTLRVTRAGRLKLAATAWRVQRDHGVDIEAAAHVAGILMQGACAPQVRAGVDAVLARASGSDAPARHRDAADLLHALQAAVGPPVWQRPTQKIAKPVAPSARDSIQTRPIQARPIEAHLTQAHLTQAHAPQAHAAQAHATQVHPGQAHPTQVRPSEARPIPTRSAPTRGIGLAVFSAGCAAGILLGTGLAVLRTGNPVEHPPHMGTLAATVSAPGRVVVEEPVVEPLPLPAAPPQDADAEAADHGLRGLLARVWTAAE